LDLARVGIRLVRRLLGVDVVFRGMIVLLGDVSITISFFPSIRIRSRKMLYPWMRDAKLHLV
jgi:hypothetical protein